MADNEFTNNVVVADDAFVVLGTAGPLKIGWSSANSRAELRDADGNVLAYMTDAGTAGTWVLNGDVTISGDVTVGGGEIWGPSGATLSIRPAPGQNLWLHSQAGGAVLNISAGDNNLYVATNIHPSGSRRLGNDSLRWSHVYSVIGNFSGGVNMSGLPTSDSGLSAGDLWVDNGTVKIKT